MKTIRLSIYFGLFGLLSELVTLSFSRLSALPHNAVISVGSTMQLTLRHENATNVVWYFSKTLSGEDDTFIYSKQHNRSESGFYVDGDDDYTLRKDSVQFANAGKYTAVVSYANESTDSVAVLVNVMERRNLACTSTRCYITYSGRIAPQLIVRDASLNAYYDPKLDCSNETKYSTADNSNLTTVTCTVTDKSSCLDCVCSVEWPPIEQQMVVRLKLNDSIFIVHEDNGLNCSMRPRVARKKSAIAKDALPKENVQKKAEPSDSAVEQCTSVDKFIATSAMTASTGNVVLGIVIYIAVLTTFIAGVAIVDMCKRSSRLSGETTDPNGNNLEMVNAEREMLNPNDRMNGQPQKKNNASNLSSETTKRNRKQ